MMNHMNPEVKEFFITFAAIVCVLTVVFKAICWLETLERCFEAAFGLVGLGYFIAAIVGGRGTSGPSGPDGRP
jgi:hypothetical protein